MKKILNGISSFFYGTGMGVSGQIAITGEAGRLHGVIILTCFIIVCTNRLVNKHYIISSP